MYIYSGTAALSDRTLLLGDTDRAVIELAGGTAYYQLPAPAGFFAPASECLVYRESANCNGDTECKSKEEECKRNTCRTDHESCGCQNITFTQPCDWEGSPELLGQYIYVLPLGSLGSFPYACSAGVLGSSEPILQRDSLCSGLCPAGKLCPSSSTTVAQECPTGHFCPGGSAVPTPCKAGTFSHQTGLSAASSCELTPSGSSTGPGAAAPTACRPGSFSAAPGSAQCEACAGGSYQREYNATACGACLQGSYCPVGASAPLPCEEGSYSNANHLGDKAECAPCPAGSACSTGSIIPAACSPGSVAPNAGSAKCSACAGGSYQAAEGKIACDACAAGSYCPQGASAVQPCRGGSYSSATNLSSADECTACPVGFSCTIGATHPTACFTGSYAGSGLEDSSAIGAGSGEPGSGEQLGLILGAEQCILCPAGSYQNASHAHDCKRCPHGHFCPEGSSEPRPCTGGTYGSRAGQHAQDECTLCPIGSFCRMGSETPEDCPRGTYGDRAGLTGPQVPTRAHPFDPALAHMHMTPILHSHPLPTCMHPRMHAS